MSSSANESIVEIFKIKLRNIWRQNPKCKNHTIRTSCSCLRPFIKTRALKEWMSQNESGFHKTNGERLIDEVNPHMAHADCHPSSILEGSDSCVLVFSWLLERGDEQLIYVFQNSGVNDHRLEDIHYELIKHRETKKELEGLEIKGRKFNFENIATDFDASRWDFCPVYLKPGIDNTPFADKLFLPFCARLGVNEKGGTGSVYWVAIQEEFVSKDITYDLGAPFDFEDHGMCYHLAVKTFLEGQRKVYSKEWQALRTLRKKKGILRFFGSYDSFDSVRGQTYNVLLEFASNDLFEWFHEFDPPQLSVEIIFNWEQICDLAAAIQALHSFERNGRNFKGWHCDIKPDNILRVDGDWKLADFGFALFQEGTSQVVPREKLLGGTETYGAPEMTKSQSSNISGNHQRPSASGISQKVDTWSFGCVLSMMATWTVKGRRGIDEYRALRTQTIKDLGLADKIAPDAFHDGSDVLPQIRYWHDHLREIIRLSDTITLGILDLIDSRLLVKELGVRLSSQELSEKLGIIVTEAKAKAENTLTGRLPMDKSVMLALLSTESGRTNSNGSANHSKLRIKVEHPSKGGEDETLLGVPANASRSHRKSVVTKIDGPHPSIPHRLELLREDLGKHGLMVSKVGSRPGSVVESEQSILESVNSLDRIPGPVPNCHEEHLQSQENAPQIDLVSPSPPFSHGSRSDPSSDQPGLAVLEEEPLIHVPEPSPSSTSSESVTGSDHSIKLLPSVDKIWDFVSASNYAATEILILMNDTAAKQLDSNGCTPMMVAAKQNDVLMVKLLMSHSDLSVKDSEGKTVLHHMIMGFKTAGRTESEPVGFFDTIKNLLDKQPSGFDLVNCLDNRGQSALLLCARFYIPKTVKFLRKKEARMNPPPDSNMRDVLLETMEASNQNNDKDDMIDVLLDEGALSSWKDLEKYKDSVSESVWNKIEKNHGMKKEKRDLRAKVRFWVGGSRRGGATLT